MLQPLPPDRMELQAAVMRFMWNSDGATARETHRHIREQFDVPYPTILTTLTRLKDMRLVGTRSEGSELWFYPLVDLEEASEPFTFRPANGFGQRSSWSLVAHFAQSKGISEEHIEELRQMIELAMKENTR